MWWGSASAMQECTEFSSHRRRGAPSRRGGAPPRARPVIQVYLGHLGNRLLNVQPSRTRSAQRSDNNDGRSALARTHNVEPVGADVNEAPGPCGLAAVRGLTHCLVRKAG